jgi:tRNA A37 threonylcarbamoyladenosine biosynthesis protein TsaE
MRLLNKPIKIKEMKKNNFIVVEGFDGSGKTSTAKWLEKELGYTYIKSPTGVFA